MPLTIFYDSQCPLCVSEMNKLRSLNRHDSLGFIDIHQLSEFPQFSDISFEAANRILHGITEDGHLIKGLDVTYEAWKAVGKGHWVLPLKWKWIRWFADPAYLFFARNRYTISRWLTGRARCQEQCQWKK